MIVAADPYVIHLTIQQTPGAIDICWLNPHLSKGPCQGPWQMFRSHGEGSFAAQGRDGGFLLPGILRWLFS